MKKSFFKILFVFVALSFSSCLSDDDSNFHFVPLQIVSADLPESFTINESYDIQVTYALPDACTGFSGFDVVNKDTTVRNVAVLGLKRTDQEVCATSTQEQTASFKFIVNYSQTYTFRFWQGEENGEQQYLEIEVPVN
jgi:hypothetical protein